MNVCLTLNLTSIKSNMAAIDKLYVKDYFTLDEIRLWATVYYPKLFLYFYSDARTMTYQDFELYKREQTGWIMGCLHDAWTRISSDGTIDTAIDFLQKEYKMSYRDAEREAKECYNDYRKSKAEIASEVEYPIMNTPPKVDKKLLWICPIKRVREYLLNNCGYKTRWYHKLFWRGKKTFLI